MNMCVLYREEGGYVQMSVIVWVARMMNTYHLLCCAAIR